MNFSDFCWTVNESHWTSLILGWFPYNLQGVALCTMWRNSLDIDAFPYFYLNFSVTSLKPADVQWISWHRNDFQPIAFMRMGKSYYLHMSPGALSNRRCVSYLQHNPMRIQTYLNVSGLEHHRIWPSKRIQTYLKALKAYVNVSRISAYLKTDLKSVKHI